MATRQSQVQVDPEILGGTPVFQGTRVPVQSLFDYLEAGDSLDVFLNRFPSVARAQAVAVLEEARDRVLHAPHLARPRRGEDAADIEIINSHAAELNEEAADVLEYQVIP